MAPKAKSAPAAPAKEEQTGYCVRCKLSKKMLDWDKKTAKNGRPMIQGKCETCGTIMTKFTK